MLEQLLLVTSSGGTKLLLAKHEIVQNSNTGPLFYSIHKRDTAHVKSRMVSPNCLGNELLSDICIDSLFLWWKFMRGA